MADPVVTPMTPAQEALLRAAGAGFLSDLAKQAALTGIPFGLTVYDAAMSGAGFVQDAFKSRNPIGPIDPGPPQPLYTAALYAVMNAVDPDVIVANAADFWQFTTGATVSFTGTGNATLDATGATFSVLSTDPGMGTFKVNADTSLATGPIMGGTINLMVAGAALIPNGYEQAYADQAAADKAAATKR